MINPKNAESYYVVNLTGDVASSLFSGIDAGIHSVLITSSEIPSDIEAIKITADIVDFFRTELNDIKEDTLVFNPDFYPSVPALEISQEELQRDEEQLEELMEKYEVKEGQAPVLITKHFDEYGDFISSKFVLRTDTSKVTAKVGIMPEQYAKCKAEEKMSDSYMSAHREITPCSLIQ